MGHAPDTAELHYHYVEADGTEASVGHEWSDDDLADGDWHEYAVDWRPGRITWIIDGRERWQVTGDAVSDEAMYLVLNLAVGGEWPGDPDEDTEFPGLGRSRVDPGVAGPGRGHDRAAQPPRRGPPRSRPVGRGTHPRDRLRAQLATPLVRAGLSLVASAGITSLLGLVYWSLAARRYSPAAIGATAGLLAAMEIVAAVANLGLRTALVRFVPALGDRAARVVAVSYAVAGLTALAGAGVFVLVHERWFPELDLLDQPAGITFFLLSCVLWVIFSLQDSVLIGLRKAAWVPTENTLYALAKLALLVGLTAPLPRWGVYVSWTAPLLAMVVVVNIPVFRMLRRPRPAPAEDLTIGDLLRFSAGDYAASALWLLTIDALPLLMLALVGAEGGAWYHLAWTVAYTLYLVSSAVGYALLAEGAHEPAALETHARRALGQGLALVVPAATVIVVGAPWLLRLFGADYATEGTRLLQLLAASAIPHVVTGVYVSIQRARRDMRAVISLYAVLGVAVVAGTVLLVPVLGVTGAGVAWLGAQSVLAAVLLATRLRDLWIGALPTRVIRALGAPGRRRTDARQRRHARRAIAALSDRGLPDLGDWAVLHATPDLVVARVGDVGAPRILKLPSSEAAEAARRKEQVAVEVLAREPVLAGWAVQVPRPIAQGVDGDQAWSLETAVAGSARRGRPRRGAGPRPVPAQRVGRPGRAARAHRPDRGGPRGPPGLLDRRAGDRGDPGLSGGAPRPGRAGCGPPPRPRRAAGDRGVVPR